MKTRRHAVALAVALGMATGGVAASGPAAHATGAQVRVHPAATPQGPFTVDMTNREDVRQFYYRVHDGANGVSPGWTGSIGSCNPGTLSSDYLAATLTRENYYRAM